jgi:ABC-type antimicrobial peptide transport system ATPase subunit
MEYKLRNDDFKIEELEKRVRDLEGRLAELMLMMLKMCPGGVRCPYANRSGTIIPDKGDVVRSWYITCTG